MEKNSKDGTYICSLEEIIKEAENTANDVIRQLESAISRKVMSYPELIRILEDYLKQSKKEMTIFKPKSA